MRIEESTSVFDEDVEGVLKIGPQTPIFMKQICKECKDLQINKLVTEPEKLDSQVQELSFTRLIQQWFENSECLLEPVFDRIIQDGSLLP